MSLLEQLQVTMLYFAKLGHFHQIKVKQPLQNTKNRQKFVFLDFCLILIFNPRTTFCENSRVNRLAEVL